MAASPELSLSTFTDRSSESEAKPYRKRKHPLADEPMTHTDIELHLDDPLPLDWEQCLDLQSGKMYYLNRKSLKKTWSMPKERKLDLDLNIASPASSDTTHVSTNLVADETKKHGNSGMFAVACLKCHLLVMLSKSSPSCPNCKYVHPLPAQKTERVKPLETLSLLN